MLFRSKNIDLLIIPCGKALGAFGAMVLGSKQLIGYLKQFARSAIYTTALPPICIATLQHQSQIHFAVAQQSRVVTQVLAATEVARYKHDQEDCHDQHLDHLRSEGEKMLMIQHC